jgi:hypothetical protein
MVFYFNTMRKADHKRYIDVFTNSSTKLYVSWIILANKVETKIVLHLFIFASQHLSSKMN